MSKNQSATYNARMTRYHVRLLARIARSLGCKRVEANRIAVFAAGGDKSDDGGEGEWLEIGGSPGPKDQKHCGGMSVKVSADGTIIDGGRAGKLGMIGLHISKAGDHLKAISEHRKAGKSMSEAVDAAITGSPASTAVHATKEMGTAVGKAQRLWDKAKGVMSGLGKQAANAFVAVGEHLKEHILAPIAHLYKTNHKTGGIAGAASTIAVTGLLLTLPVPYAIGTYIGSHLTKKFLPKEHKKIVDAIWKAPLTAAAADQISLFKTKDQIDKEHKILADDKEFQKGKFAKARKVEFAADASTKKAANKIIQQYIAIIKSPEMAKKLDALAKAIAAGKGKSDDDSDTADHSQDAVSQDAALVYYNGVPTPLEQVKFEVVTMDMPEWARQQMLSTLEVLPV